MSAQPRWIAPRSGALILGLQFLLLAFRSGTLPLLGPDEPRYARVAVEMARAREWTTPTLSREPWLEKPPLYYWLAGLATRVWGEHEFAVRLPAMLAALILTGTCGVVGSRLFGARAGVIAMLVAALNPLVFAYGQAATMDMLLAAFVSVACALFLLHLLDVAGPSSIPIAWVAIALGVLAKGPVAIILVMAFLFAVLILGLTPARRLAGAKKVATPLGVFLFAVIALPWHVAAWLENGRTFVDVYLINHNFQRFTSTIHNHPGPWYYYVPVLLTGLLPWSPWSWNSFRGRDVRPLLPWLGVPFLFFSLAGSKLPGYILPCVAPLAVLCGKELGRATADNGSWMRFGKLTAGALPFIGMTAALFGTWRGQSWGRPALAIAAWLLVSSLVAARSSAERRPPILATAAAGFLLLLSLVAPPLLEARESGRSLFAHTRGERVAAIGAWRTAWMSGYFYNDGRVREVATIAAFLREPEREKFVVCGPSECRQLRSLAGHTALVIARGPRGSELLRVD